MGRKVKARRRIVVGIAGVCLLIGAALIASAVWPSIWFDSLGEARRTYASGDYHSSLRSVQAALKRRPGDPRASLMEARCLTRLGMLQAAEASYARSGPLELDDLHDRAYGLARLGEAERAAALYDEILRDRPDDLLAMKRLAAMLMERKQWKKAGELSTKLIATPGGEIWGWTLAGIAAHESRQAEQAAAAFERVLELDPALSQMPLPHTLFWNNLALALLALGRTVEAREHLEHALKEGENPGLMELLGIAYEKEGSLDEAERCWRKALSWDPDHAETLIDLGRLSLARQRWDEAVSLLEHAAAISPRALAPVYGLSRAHRALGNAAKAAEYERLAAEIRRSQPQRGGMGGDLPAVAEAEAGSVMGAGTPEGTGR